MAKVLKKSTTKSTNKLSVDEYRALLGNDIKRQITIQLKGSDLSGSLEAIQKRLKKKVADSEIVGSWTLSYSQSYTSYDYNQRRNVTHGGPKIIGYSPYSDEELQKKGASLLAQKVKADAKAEKDRAANLAKFNALAEKLGYEPVTDE